MKPVLPALLLLCSTAHAVPGQFTHQGRLLDGDGVPLEGDTTITFRVTDSDSGGDELWEETLTVPVTNGFYSAVLGADEEGNPLDVEVLNQAPAWLELQIDGEEAMFPRSPINAVPYATMATVAEEVSGGPVDASQIAVDGTPVVNELGEWVGPAPTVNWSDIEGMPEDFADGVDDDTDTDTDSFAALGTSCLDGDTPVWDAVLVEWVCGIDAVLTEDEVDAIVADNGYAMESEVFSSSFLDLTDVPDGLDDGDDNTQLSESEVDGMVADNGYAMAADAFSRMWSDLVGIPEDLADGDDNTQLSEDEVDEMVSDNGYAPGAEVDALQARIETLEAQLSTLEDAVDEATGSAVGTVMYGNYSINNSVELAGLEGFTEVTGDLKISSGIPNVEGLVNLTRIGGHLQISYLTELTDLSGLRNLEYVGGEVEIRNNEALTSLNGLGSLETIGGPLKMERNYALTTLEGLSSLTTVSGHLEIQQNDSLTELDGFDVLESVGGQLYIYNNPLATDVSGMSSLEAIGSRMLITNNGGLLSFSGLSSLESIGGILQISDNGNLLSVAGLHGLTAIGGNIYINRNTSLCNSLAATFISIMESSGWPHIPDIGENADC